jgi:hypothetical protein
MQNDDRELEKYLSDFQPRNVRPLEVGRTKRSIWTGRLAAAAALTVSVGAGWWYAEHWNSIPHEQAKVKMWRLEVRVQQQESNTILLTKLALDDPKGFEEQMEDESQRVLPGLRGQESTLKVLAKE